MSPFHRCKWLNLVVLAGGLLALQTAAQESPDTVFVNGKILTVDEDFSVVQALAVTGNRISAVGSNDEIERLVGDDTRVIDLNGRTGHPRSYR